jgi:hypothetical protein
MQIFVHTRYNIAAPETHKLCGPSARDLGPATERAVPVTSSTVIDHVKPFLFQHKTDISNSFQHQLKILSAVTFRCIHSTTTACAAAEVLRMLSKTPRCHLLGSWQHVACCGQQVPALGMT